MRWMMYRWWCEGGGDRAWLVIESVLFRSSDTPRHAQTGFAVQFNAETQLSYHQLSSGRIVPRVTIGRVTPFIPCERPYVNKHAIARYIRLPRPTPVPALMRELHWHRSWAEDPGYATGNPPEDYGQIRGRCSFPWKDSCRLILLYHAKQHATDGTDP